MSDRSTIARLTGRVGSLRRWQPENLEGITEAERAVIVARIAQFLNEVTADGPALTEDDRDEIVALVMTAGPTRQREGA